MSISSVYDPQESEQKWYNYWMEQGFFKSIPDEREPYTIVIPPPNVTGILHMGHMLNNTIQDILIRRARMQGKNACWVPGTDHASIATEAKVVTQLKEQGIDKEDLTREEFMVHAWKWKEEYGGVILKQLQKLGASCDWDRTCFTMDEIRSKSVIKMFVDLYKKGLIYRGVRMVNWDPKAQTALSDEEVIHKEEQSKLYYLKYLIEGSENHLTIATTRPETILGDTAVCVNPLDPRFYHLKGKRVIVPLVNRSIPIIEDEYVDMEFGTGCLKITPAHDVNDYEIGLRHKLDVIDIFNQDGSISEAGELFIGEDRFDVKKKIIPLLEKAGNLDKIESYTNKVGYSERTQVVIEPKLSAQWFLKMSDLAKPALEHVMNDDVEFHPAKFKNVYNHWMGNIKDWCISRQLWWGHQIPVYYLEDGRFIVAENEDDALIEAQNLIKNKTLSIADLRQDEDVLDTWASSWLWPISVFDGVCNPDNKEIEYYYPTNDLVTGHDIIFFWVARMIMSGYQLRDNKPFNNVYFTGMVRDKQRRKMSKQLGNSPNPLDLISQYGADGVRVGMLLCSPAGGDLLFDESLPEQGRNFTNKIWNTYRLIAQWEVDDAILQPEWSRLAIEWFENKLNMTISIIEKDYEEFRLSSALMSIYTLIKEEFSSWFLECIKPEYQKPIDIITYRKAIELLEKQLQILHPFSPFITEEIWQLLKSRDLKESIMVSKMPIAKYFDQTIIDFFDNTKDVITGIRNIRKSKNIPFKQGLNIHITGDSEKLMIPIIKKLAHVEQVEKIDFLDEGSPSFMVGTTKISVPTNDQIDINEELKKLNKELKYLKGFLESVKRKLNNERFINSAPKDVVEAEKKKQEDADSKIKSIENSLIMLNNLQK